MLPIAEIVECMTDAVFRVLDDKLLYARNGADRLQAHVRQLARYIDAPISKF